MRRAISLVAVLGLFGWLMVQALLVDGQVSADKKDEPKADAAKAKRSRDLLLFLLKDQKGFDKTPWTFDGFSTSVKAEDANPKGIRVFTPEKQKEFQDSMRVTDTMADLVSKLASCTPFYAEVTCAANEALLKELAAKFGNPDATQKGSLKKGSNDIQVDWHTYGSMKVGVEKNAIVALRVDGTTWQGEVAVLPLVKAEPTAVADKKEPEKKEPEKKELPKPDAAKAKRSRELLVLALGKQKATDSKPWKDGFPTTVRTMAPDGTPMSTFLTDEKVKEIQASLRGTDTMADKVAKVAIVTPIFSEAYCEPNETLFKTISTKFGKPDSTTKSTYMKDQTSVPIELHVYGSIKIGVEKNAVILVRVDGPEFQSEASVLPQSNNTQPKMELPKGPQPGQPVVGDPNKPRIPFGPGVAPVGGLPPGPPKPGFGPPGVGTSTQADPPPMKTKPDLKFKRPDPSKKTEPALEPMDPAEKAEKESAAKLQLAKSLEKEYPDKAKQRYQEIVKKYPDTKAAEEAKKLLEKLAN